MKRKRRRSRSKAFTENSALERIVEYLIETAEPARLFEFYYWCQEPELLKIVRVCAALPEAQRHLIASFFAALDGKELVSADWSEDGQLVLCCQSGRQQAPPGGIPLHTETKSRAEGH
jgi:hypothetical protein